MIRRPAGQDFLLITQDDHALLSGKLAEHLGNQQFDPPDPAESAILGIGLHDSGWPLHDDQPTLNDHGLPLHVFEVPMAIATKVWSESVARAQRRDAYAALLVSLHVMALSDIARRHDTMPHERVQTAGELFAINKFQINQAEIQEYLRKKLSMRTDLPLHFGLAKLGIDQREDRLRFNFRYLTAMDRISLELCCGKALFGSIEEIYPKVGAKETALQLQSDPPATPPGNGNPAAPLKDLTVTPWPFRDEQLKVTVPAKRVTAQPFASVEDFRAAYTAAPVETVEFRICQRH